jgi:hypothetical protein
MNMGYKFSVISFFLLVGTLLSKSAIFPIQSEDGTTINEIVFVTRKFAEDGHWYANFGYFASDADHKAYSRGGRLVKLDLRTGKQTTLFADNNGTFRDPQVHYDGKRIVFSYRKSGQDYFHLYEIDIEGSYLRQITDGPYSDIEPVYLPDGDILFVSSRCNRWVNCWATQVAVLYRCKSDGSDMVQLSANIEHDNTPWVLPDGRIMYTRWEYVDRSQVHFHHLWCMSPDGSRQSVLFGNQHTSVPQACLLIDAKPIPGSDEIITVFSPGHGRREHAGHLARISLQAGPDQKEALEFIWKGEENEYIYDPFPLSSELFLTTTGKSLALIDAQGHKQDFYSLSVDEQKEGYQIFEPRPVIGRPQEPVIASALHPQREEGFMLVQDVYQGRNMNDPARGKIKKLLILETLPKPINYTGGNEPLTYTGSFTLERIVGTVPVESDGSAHFSLPPNKSFLFVALDDQNRAVQRMKSFTSVMPGETVTCIGCHEHRTLAPANTSPYPIAGQKPPAQPQAIAGIPEVIDFPRDIQPILDEHCVRCHSPANRSGGILLTGHRGPVYSHSYFNLLARFQVNDGRNQYEPLNEPGRVGDASSPLMQRIKDHHGHVELSGREIQLLRFWINTGATYPGTYGALGSGMIGRMIRNEPDMTPVDNTVWEKAQKVIETQCSSCHAELMPHIIEEKNLIWWKSRAEMMNGNIDEKAYFEKIRFSRHIVYDLTEPAQSTLLLAPLARDAGGYGFCTDQQQPVLSSTSDPDYQILLQAIQHSKAFLDSIKRFDMPGFVVRPEYYREMIRFGILAPDMPREQVDPYLADRQYWQAVTQP